VHECRRSGVSARARQAMEQLYGVDQRASPRGVFYYELLPWRTGEAGNQARHGQAEDGVIAKEAQPFQRAIVTREEAI
jgi:hypothetical protein